MTSQLPALTSRARRPAVAAIAFLSFATAALMAQMPGGKPPDYNAAAKQALAQLDGTILVFGLREPVEVLRDRWGVPHIFAKNTEDLFFAQGYVVAQDRMWQLEMWRRNGEGTARGSAGARVRHARPVRAAARIPWQLGRGVQEIPPRGARRSSNRSRAG